MVVFQCGLHLRRPHKTVRAVRDLPLRWLTPLAIAVSAIEHPRSQTKAVIKIGTTNNDNDHRSHYICPG
jgi:hypothetical protein